MLGRCVAGQEGDSRFGKKTKQKKLFEPARMMQILNWGNSCATDKTENIQNCNKLCQPHANNS